jgi:hypothetical protein
VIEAELIFSLDNRIQQLSSGLSEAPVGTLCLGLPSIPAISESFLLTVTSKNAVNSERELVNFMKRHYITFGLLALAIGAYLLGVAKASLVLVAIGCMIEATLWIRLFHHADQSTPKDYLTTGNAS